MLFHSVLWCLHIFVGRIMLDSFVPTYHVGVSESGLYPFISPSMANWNGEKYTGEKYTIFILCHWNCWFSLKVSDKPRFLDKQAWIPFPMKTRKSCSIAFGHSHLWIWWVDTTNRPTAGVKPPSEQCNGGESWVGWLFGAVERKRFHSPCKSREESLPKPYALRLWFGVGMTKTIVISPPSWGKKGLSWP